MTKLKFPNLSVVPSLKLYLLYIMILIRKAAIPRQKVDTKLHITGCPSILERGEAVS
jgi:hypothetical protein